MIGFFVMMLILALGMFALVTGLQWLGDRRSTLDGGGPSAAQLDRMESVLGMLEARIDDLQEQQRFLERLVAERPEARALPGPEEAEGVDGEDKGASGSGVDSILFDTGEGRNE